MALGCVVPGVAAHLGSLIIPPATGKAEMWSLKWPAGRCPLGRWVVPSAILSWHRAFKVKRAGPQPALGLQEEAGTQSFSCPEVNAMMEVNMEMGMGD